MGVSGGENPASEVLSVGKVQGEGDHGPSNALAAKIRIDENVTKPGKRFLVRNNPAVSNLAAAVVDANNIGRVSRGTFDLASINTWTPVRGSQPRVNKVEVDSGGIVVDLEGAVSRLHGS